MKKLFCLVLCAVMLCATGLSASAIPTISQVPECVTILRNGDTMHIDSTAPNTVLRFSSFDVANGEAVIFDNEVSFNNYLILVEGNKPTFIDGAISGSNNLYIVNPNGIIFGSNSIVNVGNLYASTRATDRCDADGFASDGADPLSGTSGTTEKDIIILGTILADTVFVEGNDVYLFDAAVAGIPSEKLTVIPYAANSAAGLGTILSEGFPWTVVTIVTAVVFGLGGFILGTKKKKKPALASGENTDDE